MMPTLRIKAQLNALIHNNNPQEETSHKFVYVIEYPSQTTIQQLTKSLEKYINEEICPNTQLIQLSTGDGFVLPKNDICSNVIDNNEHIICVDMNSFISKVRSTIDFDKSWLELKDHDLSDNEEKFIQIGLNDALKLFVRMYSMYKKESIYLFGFNELVQIANEKSKENLIGRIDNTNDDDDGQTPSANWFIETKWKYDTRSSHSLFILCTLKIGSSDEILTSQIHILLDHSSMKIKKDEITQLSGGANNSTSLTDEERQRLKKLQANLPPTKQTGPHIVLLDTHNFKVANYECDGDSLIRMTRGNTNKVDAYQDIHASREGVFCQHFTITHIIFSKRPTILPEVLQQKRLAPAEKPISVANVIVLYQTHDGSWNECQGVAIAPIAIRNEQPKWLTDSVINIEPDRLFSFMIRGTLLIKGTPGRDQQIRQRVHKSLPQPFKLKIVLTDNFGKQSSLIVEQVNAPVNLPTAESFSENYQSQISELLIFIYADDCNSDERIYMAAYLDKENHLIIKNPSVLTNTYERITLRTMEYNAKRNQTTEVLLNELHNKTDSYETTCAALFDPETYMLYAMKFEITTATSSTQQTIPIPIEKIC